MTSHIESLTVRNFQKHSKETIEFDPHVTTLIGPNDRGKSAFLRALRWICLNQPSGDEFRKWDTKNTSARLVVDGTVIKRKRGKTNSYSLDEREYKAFGAGKVPAPIEDLLNVTENNFQDQSDPAFWFSDSPAQVSRNLNQIVNLEVIDKTLEAVASEVRRSKAVVAVSEERLQTAREKKKNLDWILDVDEDLKKLERQEERIEATKQRIQYLRDLITTIQRADLNISNATPAVQKGRKLLETAKVLREKRKRLSRLSNLVGDIRTEKENSCSIEKRLEKFQTQLAKVKLCPACQRPIKSSE